jgi:hypothetical protein
LISVFSNKNKSAFVSFSVYFYATGLLSQNKALDFFYFAKGSVFLPSKITVKGSSGLPSGITFLPFLLPGKELGRLAPGRAKVIFVSVS